MTGQLDSIPDHLKAGHLEKVAASRTFARSEQLRRLLQWLGKRTLANAAVPTEYQVAIEALRRGDGFDPKTDSLVRKEMSRLRNKLAEYYAGEGTRDQVVIRTNGSYRLKFERRLTDAPMANGEGCPCLLVLPPAAGAADVELAETVYDELMLQLATAAGVRVLSRTSARWYGSQAGDIREIVSQCGAAIAVEVSVRRSSEHPELMVWMVDGLTGVVMCSARFAEGSEPAECARKACEWLVARGRSVANLRDPEQAAQ